jgi:hypothetical protein
MEATILDELAAYRLDVTQEVGAWVFQASEAY